MPKKYRSGVMASIHEAASDLCASGGMARKTMRRLDVLCLTPIEELTLPQRNTGVPARHQGLFGKRREKGP